MRIIVCAFIFLVACESNETHSDVPFEFVDMAGEDLSSGQLGDAGIAEDSGHVQLDAALPVIDLTASATASCKVPITYELNRAIFTDATDAWGLSELGVKGTRLTVGDINSDGRPDFVARRAGTHFDHFTDQADTTRRFHWLLLNRGDSFEDVTQSSGWNAVRGTYPATLGRPSEVVAFADVDNDGDLDAYTGVDVRQMLTLEIEGSNPIAIEERSELLINDGSGQFTLSAPDHTLRRLNRQDVPSGISFIDVNLDGNLDAWITQGGLGAPMQDRLWLGDGVGEFEDITTNSGVKTETWVQATTMNEGRGHSTAWSALACDLNNDGYAELMAGSYGRAPNHLWRATPTEDEVSYVNESVGSGYAFDDDQSWDDNQFAACYCNSNPDAQDCDTAQRPRISCNQTNWRHTTDREPFRLGGNTRTTVCADFDNNGWADLVTTEIKHWWAGAGSDSSELLLNTQSPTVRFARPGNEQTGLAIEHAGASWDEGIITATWLDFDNDGRKDLYMGGTDYNGNRGRLYHNQSSPGEPVFREVASTLGIDQHRSHGVAAADFDQDGDIDLVIGHSRNRCDATDPTNCYATRQVRLFENTLSDSGNWLQLKLEGSAGTNRSAIGAIVMVTTADRTQRFEVGGGYGHYGAQDDLLVHIGLGAACDAVVDVSWPTVARPTTRYRLPANHRFQITQNQQPVFVQVVD